MNSDYDNTGDEIYNEDFQSMKLSVDNLKRKVSSKKKSKSKRFIPRVWKEGPKMYIRGKAQLTLSNDEIRHKIQEKEKHNRTVQEEIATAHEVITGSQSTISQFFGVKPSTNHNRISSSTSSDVTCFKSPDVTIHKENTCDVNNQDITSEDEDLSWVMKKCAVPTIVDWKAMESDSD